MKLDCIIRYAEALTDNLIMPELDFCIIIAINIVGFLIICLFLYFYRKTPRTAEILQLNQRHTPSPFHELHTATFENDVIRSIRLVQKYPQGINQPHPIDGYTPFMRACLNGNTQLVNLMINFGADISLKSSKGETPFYLAVFYLIHNRQSKDATCIRSLYYAGSDINATNAKGYTALHLAAMFGHTSLARWLLSKGASAFVQPFPYVIARLQGHYETAMVLRNRGMPAIESN